MFELQATQHDFTPTTVAIFWARRSTTSVNPENHLEKVTHQWAAWSRSQALLLRKLDELICESTLTLYQNWWRKAYASFRPRRHDLRLRRGNDEQASCAQRWRRMENVLKICVSAQATMNAHLALVADDGLKIFNWTSWRSILIFIHNQNLCYFLIDKSYKILSHLHLIKL